MDAALRLRMSLEALTYERAMTYADDLGPEQMKTWQPIHLMDRMLEVDPRADKDASLSFGLEPSFQETPQSFTLLGTDKVLKLTTLREHYNALGSYLHTPTLRQLEKGKAHDLTKLRNRCAKIIEAVEIVLSSRVWATSITNTGTIECSRCGYKLRRRIPHAVDVREVVCWECNASYTMRLIGEGQVKFKPHQVGIPCISSSCEETNYLWEDEFRCGTEWSCQTCGKWQKLALGVTEEYSEDLQDTL